MNVVRPITPELKAKDPLVHEQARAGAVFAVLFLAAASILHGAVIATAFVAATAFARKERPRHFEQIEVAVIEQPIEPEPPPAQPEPQPEPEPQSKPKPKRTPPPDPIDIPKEAPPPPPPTPVRRIVGLSLESTVEGGGGPTFATGNTRMGTTARIAEDPNEAKPLPKPTEKVLPSNRIATRLPSGSRAVLVKPKPIGGMQDAPYPELYKAQGIEADVTVRVRIDVTGRVIEAEVVAPAPQPEFNRNAKETAAKQRFEPATRDGAPIEWTLTFTYRFRLVN